MGAPDRNANGMTASQTLRWLNGTSQVGTRRVAQGGRRASDRDVGRGASARRARADSNPMVKQVQRIERQTAMY